MLHIFPRYHYNRLMEISSLQKHRYTYAPKLPVALQGEITRIAVSLGNPTEAVADADAVRALFPHTYGKPIATFTPGAHNQTIAQPQTVGVILSGGQAPGGHNVIAGIFDALTAANKDNRLIGFLGGPGGLVTNSHITLSKEIIDEYRNTGGFDIIGSGRTKIETPEQFAAARQTCITNNIDALVVIGGDDSNTNAALLAEYFLAQGDAVQVVGVPKTIDGDLKNEYIEASFGFDTATKTYSELIGNIQRDANSARKYWHFIRLMGRSASHIALECALQTRPTVCLISEEVQERGQTVESIVSELADAVCARGAQGEQFGVVLIPEGLIEFIPEMKTLIHEINDLLAAEADAFGAIATEGEQVTWLLSRLTSAAASVFGALPQDIQLQLLMDRDPHGNVQVSRIDTEKLLIRMVETEVAKRREAGETRVAFNGLNHFFGYEGRCAFPSNFDADYTYSLGYNAYLLIASGLTGYLSSIRNIAQPASEWIAGGIPLTMMMNMEQRHGSQKPVIRKALVELDGAPFRYFAQHRQEWAHTTSFVYPGAIQYYGPPELCDQPTKTLLLEQGQEL